MNSSNRLGVFDGVLEGVCLASFFDFDFEGVLLLDFFFFLDDDDGETVPFDFVDVDELTPFEMDSDFEGEDVDVMLDP